MKFIQMLSTLLSQFVSAWPEPLAAGAPADGMLKPLEALPLVSTSEFAVFWGHPGLRLMPLYATATNQTTWPNWVNAGLHCFLTKLTYEQLSVLALDYDDPDLTGWVMTGRRAIRCGMQAVEEDEDASAIPCRFTDHGITC